MDHAATTRRQLLGALGCSAAAFPLMTRITLASAPWDARLVVIVLRGAMDGLDVLRPVGDPGFAALRPDPGGTATPLDGRFALHDGLSPLLPLWQAGELAFAHAVSTPYRDGRSHFDGQDILEAGGSAAPGDGGLRDGWLNRLLQATPGAEAETGFAIGRENLRILTGAAPVANWSPQTRLALGESAEQLLALAYRSDPLFHDAAAEAVALARSVAPGGGGGSPDRALAEFAAARLRGDTRIASFSLSGWDTHSHQARRMPGLLARLADTILTLRDGLGPVWGRTAVLAMTEFGRTARLNGSGGTDHGTGGALLLAGGAVRGGRVHADWPGLEEADLYDRRDLRPTRDLRAYAGWAMAGLFGLDTGLVQRAVFPGLELGADPGVVL
ncbi:DUF1501 domain-containing protein [Roseicyclus persicicus]|uniref:DUF1501 domain-containing protein n=1 Tax=Roseicyclus persicicus TaxID=2650661 RepID=A0A7X6H0V6_9RHOB|nr:DUF1501 domain-containing protein [Roseibacterium persicicum]NKX44752.1 DUF1501 domain-containing protein [Roseibacterium persicicum]